MLALISSGVDPQRQARPVDPMGLSETLRFMTNREAAEDLDARLNELYGIE
jgi:hypothetical protein